MLKRFEAQSEEKATKAADKAALANDHGSRVKKSKKSEANAATATAASGTAASASSSSSSSASASGSGAVELHKYVNKQRTLVFCSRGITHRDRHFMQDVRDLLPHSKRDVKLDHKDSLNVVNEVAELKNCNNVIFLESRKHKDLYMWIARAPNGPSAKFLVQNVHTMAEVKLTGNCLRGSRPLLSFDAAFDSTPAYQLLKTLFTQVFGSPKGHPKVKPFVDHVLSFFIADERVWFRNYQIVYDTDESRGAQKTPVLVEIGPRFVLNPIKIFDGSFGGNTLWDNPKYLSPQVVRASIGQKRNAKYTERVAAKKQRREYVAATSAAKPEDELRDVFETEKPEVAARKAADTALSKYHKTAVQKAAIETAELANRVLKEQAEAEADDDDGDADADADDS